MRAGSWPKGRASQLFRTWILTYTVISSLKIVSCTPQTKTRRSILNRDIVFLAAERPYHEDGTPIYPTAKLGDFGLTIITGDNDPRNPAQLKGHGTPGYKAPVRMLKK